MVKKPIAIEYNGVRNRVSGLQDTNTIILINVRKPGNKPRTFFMDLEAVDLATMLANWDVEWADWGDKVKGCLEA